MLARVSPSCVAVPRYIDNWKVFAHAAALIWTFEPRTASRLTLDEMSRGRMRTRDTSATVLSLELWNAEATTCSQPSSECTITNPWCLSNRRLVYIAHASHSHHRSMSALALLRSG